MGRRTNEMGALFFVSILLVAGGRLCAQGPNVEAITKGDVRKFSTKGHPKAKGLSISFSYPANWTMKEGERPHVIQKFVAPGTQGVSRTIMILIHDLPPEVKKFEPKELAEIFFSSDTFGGFGSLLEWGRAEFDGEPGAWAITRNDLESAGVKRISFMLVQAFLFDGNFIQIQCFSGGPKEDIANTQKTFQENLSLFRQVGNSIVIDDKRLKNTGLKDSNTDFYSVAENKTNAFTLTGNEILIYAIFTWGIGLLPPLVLRFVFLRKSIGKQPAIWIVIVFWFLNFIFFTLLGSESKSHMAITLIAFASYAILRKGALRQDEVGWNKGAVVFMTWVYRKPPTKYLSPLLLLKMWAQRRTRLFRRLEFAHRRKDRRFFHDL